MTKPLLTASILLLAASAAATLRAQDGDAGVVEARLPVESVMGGAPSPNYGGRFVGCELVVHGTSAEFVCPEQRTEPCVEVARRDLTPDAGDEIVLGCGRSCGFEDEGTDPGVIASYPVFAVLSAAGPLAAIATTEDMSCGSALSFRIVGRRTQLVLVGGGTDGTYRATYGTRGGRFVQLRVGYAESTY